MSFTEKVVSKPVTILFIFLILVGTGLFTAKKLQVDMLPDSNYPNVMVISTYGNSSPEEVEQNLTRVLEKGLSGLSGLKNITSTSSTGYSSVRLEFVSGTNLEQATNDIREKLDGIKNQLPSGATNPTIKHLDASMLPFMNLVLQGNKSPEELYCYADSVIAPALEQTEGVASVDISGGQEKSIQISVLRSSLEAYNLTISSIAQNLKTQNMTASGGIIKADEMNWTVLADGTFKSIEDIKNTVAAYRRSESTGQLQPVLIRDIADVYESPKESTSLAYYNGKPAVILSLQKQSDKNTVTTCHNVRKSIVRLQKTMTSDIHLVETSNDADQIEATIREVIKSLVEGALLAIIVLFLFFRNVKSTIIIGVTIPVSMIVTLVFMYFTNMTINLLSLAGLLVGVGMLVDNSIVVLENIYTHAAKGEDAYTASVNGTKEMIMPVFSSTLTSVCIFLPMIIFKRMLGLVGAALINLAATISFALLCSFASAVLLIPVLTAHYLKITPQAIQQSFSEEKLKAQSPKANFWSRITGSYTKAVSWVIHHKLITIIALIIVLIASIATIPGRGFELMPVSTEKSLVVNLTLPKGTPLEETDRVIHLMEANAYAEDSGIIHSNITIGDENSMSSSNTAKLELVLNHGSEELKYKLRKYFYSIPDAQWSFSSSSLFSVLAGSGNLEIKMKSNDKELLRETASKIQKLVRMNMEDKISEISSDFTDGMPEINIKLDREAMNRLGISVQSVASELRASISGINAGTYNYNNEETDIIVALDEKDKKRSSDLNSIYVIANDGKRYPLAAIAHYEESRAPASIKRDNQMPVASVSITPAKGLTVSDIQAEVNSLISQNIPEDENLTFITGGDLADMIAEASGFAVVIVMAIILVFAVMASQFESIKDPFIIIFTLPLSFIGVALIYLLTGQKISLMSIFGILMLVGIIVNNGIVLVDYANQLRKKGMELEEACIESARSRLRPILMSTLTTIISLIPMAFWPSKGAEMIQPVNITVLGGLGFGTIMTLFIMPAIYYIFNANEKVHANK
ncbi:MAG: efflux RND transporter permease subunit [Treponema sp.]|nr:efflux RND transporter permease subunit [Treponema sp.]